MKKIIYLLLISILLINCSDDNNPPETLKYTLTAEAKPAEGGSISPASGNYNKSSEITLKATPANGYTFKKWTGGVTGDSNPVTLTMNSDKKVEAEFEKIVPKTYVIADNDWKNNIVSVNETDYTFVFNSEIKEKYEIKEGNFLVGTLNGGYLRKISKITESNNQITFKTEFASITEAFPELHEEASATLVPNYDSEEFWIEEGITINNYAAKGITTDLVNLDIDQILFDLDGDYSSVIDQIRINGKYILSADFDINIDNDYSTIENLKLQYELKQVIDINGYMGYEGEKNDSINITRIPCGLIYAGPVVIEPIVDIYLGYSINLSTSLDVSFYQEYTSNTTLTYNGNNWNTEKSIEEIEKFSKPEIKGALDAKLFLKPVLSFRVYKIVSPYIEVELFGKANVELQSNILDWKTMVGIDLNAGVNMKIFNKTLFDFKENIYNWEHIINQGQFDIGIKPIADFTVNNTSINEGESISFTDQSTNSPTSWSWDFGDGSNSTEQNPAHTYNTAGTYTVSLTATNTYGTDNETKNNYVTVVSSGSGGETGTFTDQRDGHIYKWIKIGDQIWMSENLAYIPHVSTSNTYGGIWVYGYEGNNVNEAKSSDNYSRHGCLYSFEVAKTAIPDGWHLASDNEWKQLENHLGMQEDALDIWGYRSSGSVGTKLKSKNGWYNQANGTDEYGFSAFPSGYRTSHGWPDCRDCLFNDIGILSYYMTSTMIDSYAFWCRSIGERDGISRPKGSLHVGYSIRCIKD